MTVKALPLITALALFPALAVAQKGLKKELESPYLRWEREDAAYILTDEERKALHKLGTDEEREQFVEQFWRRRDPTPDTIENEYKEEHYRRLAYANERFASGIPGWKTDRGRMYIRFGPPDEIEAHPSGGTYRRPQSEGGGQTSTYPFEQWRYRHLDNVGDDIVLEFVDQSLTGEYRLAGDPCAKDALAHVPGADRFRSSGNTTCEAMINGHSAGRNEFDRLDLAAKIEKAPEVKFKDLEAMVSSRVSFNTLPFAVRVDYLRVTDFSVMANVTVQFENRDLQFALRDGFEMSAVNIFGRIYTLTRRTASTFEAPVETLATPSMMQQIASGKSMFQQSVPLAPGKYRLSMVARDLISGSLGQYDVSLEVPGFEEGQPAAGSLILADLIEPLPTRNIGGQMFAIGDTRVRPRVGSVFGANERMGVYLQFYNFKPSTVSYEIRNTETKQRVMIVSEALTDPTIRKLLPLAAFAPGTYSITVTGQDGAKTVQQSAPFSVR